jgi:predicted nucleic acid-binding Zn ribbon protein
MAAIVAVATDSGGAVIELLMKNRVHLPVLSDVCTDPIAESISAFQAKILSKRKREELIRHAMHCRPCRRKLGWGEL